MTPMQAAARAMSRRRSHGGSSTAIRIPFPDAAAGGLAAGNAGPFGFPAVMVLEVMDAVPGLKGETAAAAPLNVVDEQKQDEGNDERDRSDGGGLHVLVLLQLGDDQERGDFRFHGHVSRDENDGAVFSEGPGESQGESGEKGRPQYGQDDAEEGLEAGGSQGG